MSDTRKEFEEVFTNHFKDSIGYNTYERMYIAWQACQSLNDKRIQQLLAVIEAKDALMNQCIENNMHLADGDICTLKPIKEAIAIKTGDVELVDVMALGSVTLNGEHIGTKLYTIKTKE